MSMFHSDVIAPCANARNWQRDWGGLPVGNAGGNGQFSALYQRTHAEIIHYIKQGTVAHSPTLSLEGHWVSQRVNHTGQEGGVQNSLTHKDTKPTFLANIDPYVHEAAAKLGVAPQIVAAHAALESGWGKRPLTQQDGSPSYNLFGIKAGGAWYGDVVTVPTTEYVDGKNVKRIERFRAYPDLQRAFTDYTQLIMGNRRFHAALGVGNDVMAFAQALVRGGYATDPDYVNKMVHMVASIGRQSVPPAT